MQTNSSIASYFREQEITLNDLTSFDIQIHILLKQKKFQQILY